jgi:hypothetical protein
VFDMTPQPYALACTHPDDPRITYLVLGWTPEAKPVVVDFTYRPARGTSSEPFVLEGRPVYFLPASQVSVEGEVGVSGELDTTVRGTKANDALLIYRPGD